MPEIQDPQPELATNHRYHETELDDDLNRYPTIKHLDDSRANINRQTPMELSEFDVLDEIEKQDMEAYNLKARDFKIQAEMMELANEQSQILESQKQKGKNTKRTGSCLDHKVNPVKKYCSNKGITSYQTDKS